MGQWLFKSDPESFGIDDLARCPDRTTNWDGIRNYQARNYLRDDVRVGDRVLFHHSQQKPPALMGLAEVVKAAYPDPTALDPNSKYHDPKASVENPIWVMVDIRLVRKFAEPLSLERLRAEPALAGLELLRTGSRLSIQPVSQEHFLHILRLAGESGAT